MPNKIIFLDFDGVLNSTSSFLVNTFHKKQIEIANPNNISVGLLDLFCSQDPDVKIVVSSSWRHGRTIDELKEILKTEFGSQVLFDRVIDKTPSDQDSDRRKEINRWIRANETTFSLFAIVDDVDDWFESWHDDNLITTDPEVGFDLANFRRLHHILDVKLEEDMLKLF